MTLGVQKKYLDPEEVSFVAYMRENDGATAKPVRVAPNRP